MKTLLSMLALFMPLSASATGIPVPDVAGGYDGYGGMDHHNFLMTCITIGLFSIVSLAFVAYAERKGWPKGTRWVKALLTPRG
ncbi:hypothetical protein ACGTN6_20440 [Halomonas sp. THAF12]|uniref:hypothetical protein n=1 Tax=Halomonas sp. B23F22_10 TaxID=3459515 RepID=UPI00373E8C1D